MQTWYVKACTLVWSYVHMLDMWFYQHVYMRCLLTHLVTDKRTHTQRTQDAKYTSPASISSAGVLVGGERGGLISFCRCRPCLDLLICLSVCVFVRLSICLPVCLSAWLPAWLSVSVCLSLSICLCMYLSVGHKMNFASIQHNGSVCLS
jgi:hypothetical protein